MALSARARAKGAESARKLLPQDTVLRDYVVGRANARLTTGAIVALSIFSCAFLIALALGTILIPGGLLLIYVVHAARPPRVLVVADQGVAVLEKSFLNGRPSKVLAMIPAGMMIVPGAPGQTAVVDLGAERVSFTTRESDRLRAALQYRHVAA